MLIGSIITGSVIMGMGITTKLGNKVKGYSKQIVNCTVTKEIEKFYEYDPIQETNSYYAYFPVAEFIFNGKKETLKSSYYTQNPVGKQFDSSVIVYHKKGVIKEIEVLYPGTSDTHNNSFGINLVSIIFVLFGLLFVVAGIVK